MVNLELWDCGVFYLYGAVPVWSNDTHGRETFEYRLACTGILPIFLPRL